MNKKIIIFIVVILVVIAALFAGNEYLKRTQNVDNNGNQNQGEQQQPTENTVTAPNQASGSEVFIEEVTLTQDGYVVIHKVNEDGSPGDVIGVSEALSAGEHTNIVIQLDEETAEGESVIAMLHQADGNGTFDFPGGDTPLTDAEGNIIQVSFDILSEGQLENEVKL